MYIVHPPIHLLKETIMSVNLVLDRANKTLQATVANLAKTAAELTTLVQQSEAVSLQIEDKNAELAALQAANDTAFREGAAELRLRVKEDRDTVLTQLMADAGLARISGENLTALQTNLAEALRKDEAELKAAVAQAVAAAQREAKAAAVEVAARNSVENAGKDAKITSLEGQLAFMTQQVANLQGQIEAERSTRLSIAQADAQRQGVVVNAGK